MSEAKVNEFDAAKKIAETLSTVEKDKRSQVLRWAAESAGVSEAATSVLRLPPTSAALAESTTSHAPPGTAPDIKTFVSEKNPKNDVQFATVVAYYYRFQAGASDRKEAIGPEDLQQAARMAGRPRFKKPTVPLSNASTLGYLNRAGGGHFSINAVGENLVAMTLPGTNGGARSPARPRRSGKKATLNGNSKSKR